jgi:signal transduction histidine kinase
MTMTATLNYSSGYFPLTQTLRPPQIVTVTVVLTLFLFVPQIWLDWRAYDYFKSVVQQEFQLQILTDRITYLDEVLTMSARMNAATGDSTWEQRYRLFEPQLDAAIKESIRLAPEPYTNKDALKTDAANQRLVEMEYQSFNLVRKNQIEAAQAILSSREYEIEKEKYAEGVATRNRMIGLQLNKKVVDYRQQLSCTTLLSLVSLIMLIPAWLFVLRALQEYLKARNIAQAVLEITNEELKEKNIQVQQALQKLQQTQAQLIQAEKMSSLGQMIAGIAHEINNPVSFISGNLIYAKKYAHDLLKLVKFYQQQYPNPPQAIQAQIKDIDLDFLHEDFTQLLESMMVGTNRIEEIVQSLRNFSRRDEKPVKQVDIHEGINSMLMILHHRLQATRKRPEITVIKEYSLLPLVECYPSQLNQVFMNIFANAINALEEGVEFHEYSAPSIRICTEVIAENWIGIHIIDNGLGIAEQIHTKIFDPFFTTQPVGKGTGLGLFISYQIVVDTHGGKLYCNSTLGQGTEFVIEIPTQQRSRITQSNAYF